MSTVDRSARPAPAEAGRLLARGDHLPDRPGGRAEGGQARGARGAEARRQGDRADLREGLDADALRVRGRRLRPGRARHLHRPRRLAHGPQGDGQGHRARARPHVRRDRVPRLRPGHAEELAQWAGVPVYNGLTDEWHPTQILADFLTFREHLAKPLDEVVVLLPRRRPLQHGRLVPRRRREARHGRADREPEVAVAARRDRRRSRSAIAAETGATITITDDVAEAVRGADVLLTDVWVSMGEPDEVWKERIELLTPYQVNAETMAADGQPGREVHALPAGVPQHRHRRSARRSSRSSGWTRSR